MRQHPSNTHKYLATSEIKEKAFHLVMPAAAILTLFFTTTTAQAQGNGPGFHVSAGGDLNCPSGQTISLATPPASIGPITFPCTSGQGTAAAEADTFRVRALGHSEHICCGTASAGNGSARIQFDNVVISGPAAASVPVSLNFSLRGTLTGNTNFGQHGLFLFLRLGGMSTDSKIEANEFGIYNKSGVFAPLTVGFPNGAIDQAFVTPVGNVPPNQPLRFDIQLGAGSAMAGNGFTEVDFFSGNNGFFLPFGIPVFNLPPGYTINIPELNIVNNFVQLPAVVNGDIFIVGTNASEISLPGVNHITGNLTIDGNTSATGIDLSELDTVGGSVSVNDNTSATGIDLSELDTVGGSVSVNDNTAAMGINLPALTSAGTSVDVSGNTSATNINLPALTSAGTSVDVSGNSAASGIALGSLTSTGGSVNVSANGSATVIDLGSLASAGGSVNVSANGSATVIDLGSLASAGGPVNVSANGSATVIDLASLGVAGGGVFIANNGPCTNVIVGGLTMVNGNLTMESCGSGTFTPGSAAASGDTNLTTSGYTSVNGSTATGNTRLSNKTAEASMTVQLPIGSFSTPASYSLTHLDPALLAPELGLDPNNAPAIIDPVAAYQFTFGVPTLNRDATLSFDVFLAGLDPATVNALLTALTNGNVTLATRGDAPGSQYQAFPICGPSQTPTAGGCVLVELLDANGQPTTGNPAIVRFSNVVGHFSTWAVAIVTPLSNPTNSFNGLLSPYPAQPHTTTPTFKRGSVVPLKFNWVNTAGLIVDSAAANPSVAVFPTSCLTQTPSTTPITAEDAGNSGGLRYDANTQTWTFNWSTKPLAAGCFVVRVTTSNAAYAAPTNSFPIALRDR
jgi:hypothetical protein